jgi:hypothetical protein
MFSWHWPKVLPSADQRFRALACEGAGWERVEWGIGRRRLFYISSRWLMLSSHAKGEGGEQGERRAPIH